MSRSLPFPLTLFRFALLLPLFAAYGVLAIVRGSLHIAHRASVAGRFLRRRLPCPGCGELSDTTGRWLCAGCGSVYLGAVIACAYCGAHASHYPCERCGASIALEPWRSV